MTLEKRNLNYRQVTVIVRMTSLETSVTVSISGNAETSDIRYFKWQGFNRGNRLHWSWETEKVKRGPRDNPDISNCQKQLQPRAEKTKGRLRGYKNLGAQRRSWK